MFLFMETPSQQTRSFMSDHFKNLAKIDTQNDRLLNFHETSNIFLTVYQQKSRKILTLTLSFQFFWRVGLCFVSIFFFQLDSEVTIFSKTGFQFPLIANHNPLFRPRDRFVPKVSSIFHKPCLTLIIIRVTHKIETCLPLFNYQELPTKTIMV